MSTKKELSGSLSQESLMPMRSLEHSDILHLIPQANLQHWGIFTKALARSITANTVTLKCFSSQPLLQIFFIPIIFQTQYPSF